MAFVSHLHHGSEILFTHGPLGFLVSPALWYRSTAFAAWLFALVALIGLSFTIVRALSRWLPLPVAMLVAVIATARIDRPAPDLIALAVLLGAILFVEEPARPDRAEFWVGAAAVLSAVELLVKFNDGIYCLVVVCITTAALRRGALVSKVRAVLTVLSGTAGAVIGLWIATGQELGTLWTWVRGSIELSTGYGAMAIQAPGREWDFVIIALWGVTYAAAIATTSTSPHRNASAALILAGGFFEIKHGLVRHNAHVLQLFLFMAVLPLVVSLSVRGRPVAICVSALAFAGLMNARPVPLAVLLNPVARAAHAGSQLRDITSSDRAQRVQLLARRRMAAALGLDPPVLAALAGHTVQVDPWDTEVIWVYHLRWKPAPVFQSYSAYTPALDRLNADSIAGNGAPEMILRARKGDIDERVIAYESPAYYLNELCRYRQVTISPNWQVLRRADNACGTETVVERVQAVNGESVRVPPPQSSESLVVARVHTRVSAGPRLLALVFKPLQQQTIARNGGPPERLVEANLSGPLIMSMPASAPVGPGTDGRIQVSSLVLSGIVGAADIEFSEVPYTPS